MTKAVLAAAQLGPADEDKARTADRLVQLLGAARDAGVQLLSFPELALTPYFCADDPDKRYADDPDSPHLRRIRAAIRDCGVATVLPIAERADGTTYNSALLFDADGQLRGRQRKVHLPVQEQRHFRAGRRFTVHRIGPLAVGVVICADRAFPESWRVLGLAGAELVCAPYNTSTMQAFGCPAGTAPLDWARDIQVTRMRAAAMADGYFILAAGKGGRERGQDYIGDSMIISPWGEIVARAQTAGDELVVAEVDLAQVRAFRRGGRYIDQRVPEAYELLTAQRRSERAP